MVLLHKQCAVPHIFIPCTNFIHSYLKTIHSATSICTSDNQLFGLKKMVALTQQTALPQSNIIIFSLCPLSPNFITKDFRSFNSDKLLLITWSIERLGNNVFNALWENSPDKVCNILSKIWTQSFQHIYSGI